jgi:hypothetical protein
VPEEAQLIAFFEMSTNKADCFPNSSVSDFRAIREKNFGNLRLILRAACKLLAQAADPACKVSTQMAKQVKGAVHIITRIYPLCLEEKTLQKELLWMEDCLLISLVDSLMLLLFKPEFTILPHTKVAHEPNYTGKFYARDFLRYR